MLKSNKIQRHLGTKHLDVTIKSKKYFSCGLNRKKLLCLKALKSSCLVNLHTAKAENPHFIGEKLIIPVVKEAVKVMVDGKEAKQEYYLMAAVY